jgi:hypothetical protein
MDPLIYSTFYCSVLPELESALLHVDDHIASQVLGGYWEYLVGLARERMQLLKAFDSGAITSSKACDNSAVSS